MHNSKDSLRDLLVPERSNRLLETAERLVQDMLEQPGEFAVWGAGNSGIYTRRFLEERSGGVLRPSYIVDNNSSLWGRDNIISPEEFFQLPDCPKRLIIAVYVADQVLEQLKGFSYDGAVDCLNMVAYYRAGDLWSIYEEHFHQLEETYNLLSDDRSRSTFAGFLNYVRTLDDRYLAQINGDSRDKLMDPSILRPGKQECFLDVGAFTGDTIASFLRSTQGAYQSITAFEPDVENYRALCQFADKSGLERITLKRMAAGPENCRNVLTGQSRNGCGRYTGNIWRQGPRCCVPIHLRQTGYRWAVMRKGCVPISVPHGRMQDWRQKNAAGCPARIVSWQGISARYPTESGERKRNFTVSTGWPGMLWRKQGRIFCFLRRFPSWRIFFP